MPTPVCASSSSIAIRGPSMPTGSRFLAIQALMVTPLLFVALMQASWRGRAWRHARLALLRVAGWTGGAGLLRPRLLRRYRAGEFPLAVAGLPRPAAAAAGAAFALATPGCERPRGCSRGLACWRCLRSTPRCRVPERACAQRGGQVVSSPISPVGTTLAEATRDGSRRCRKGRASLPTISRSAPSLASRWESRISRCSTIRSTTSMAARRSCGCGGCSTQAVVTGSKTPTLLVVGVTEVSYKDLLNALPRTVRNGRPAAAAAGAQHRSRPAAFPAVRAGSPKPRRRMHDAGDGVDRHAGRGRAVGREFDLSGWAFKDGVGLARVEVMLDGKVVARAPMGALCRLRAAWPQINDPQHPQRRFQSRDLVDARDVTRGAPLAGAAPAWARWQRRGVVRAADRHRAMRCAGQLA